MELFVRDVDALKTGETQGLSDKQYVQSQVDNRVMNVTGFVIYELCVKPADL